MSSQKLEFAEGDVNSSARGSGARANKGKVSFSLIPWHLLAGTARVFMGGKLKYAEWNWAKGMSWSTCVDCLFRHLIKWWYMGEDIDPESGEHHLDHMFCNLLMLRHYAETYKEGDDRPDGDLTGFPQEMDYFNRLFDMEDFLERNPAIKAKFEEERQRGKTQS
jgi:hypothetical protein